MPLTREFRETVEARAKQDLAFCAALLEEAMQAFVDGEVDEARTLLRTYINATIGFEALSKAVHSPAKSLMRMVGPNGNPTADRLGAILRALREESHVSVRVAVTPLARRGRAGTRLEPA